MNVREKLVELLKNAKAAMKSENISCDIARNMFVVDFMMAHGVTVQEWINSEEMLPEFPCLIVRPDGKAVTIPEGILTIKDEHGEWCINASLDYAAKLMDGSEISTLVWENRITYWMPLPELPKGE